MLSPWARGTRHTLWGLPLLAALLPAASAQPRPPASGELEALRAEVARLRAENARLRSEPAALAAQVNSAVAKQDGPRAEAALKQLADHFPYSAELGPATRRVAALQARMRAAEQERKRLAALGFKALRVRPVFADGDTELRLDDSSLTRRWNFDSYGHGWKYLEPEKGQRLLTAGVIVNSKSKDPALFGMAVYAADGAALTQVGSFRYRFARWADFGAYLGNHADFRNDFSHSSRIAFSTAASVSEEDSKRRPLYVVATREGCHKRQQDRLLQPPIHYLPGKCDSLKKTLTVDDFSGGSLAVLRRID